MQQPNLILFFPNGNVGAFDRAGEQIGEIQSKGWIQLYFEYLESLGIDPVTVRFEAIMNDGRWAEIKPFRTDWGWNVEIVRKEDKQL